MKMSNTIQRRILLEELCKLKTHPTAETLYEIVRQRLPRISLGTVYRNLELLANANVIMKIEVAGKGKRFDGNPNPHHHLRCEKCDAVEDIQDDPEIQKMEEELLHRFDSRFRAVRLSFSGLCEQCAKEEILQKKTVANAAAYIQS